MAAASPYFQELYRMRLQASGCDLANPPSPFPLREICGPALDWVLAEPRTEYLSGTTAITTAGYFLATKGLGGLLGNLENVGAAALLVYGPGRWLRGRRGIGSQED